MTTVNQEVSVTLNLGNFNSTKVTVGINDLDPLGDIDAQLAEAKPAIERMFKGLLSAVDEQLVEIEKRTTGG